MLTTKMSISRTSSVIDEPVIGHRSTLSPPERSFRIPEMSEATYSEPVWSDNSGPVSRPRQRPSVLSLSSSNTGKSCLVYIIFQ